MSSILSNRSTNSNSPGLCSGFDDTTQLPQLEISRPSIRICQPEMSHNVSHRTTKPPAPQSRIIQWHKFSHDIFGHIKYPPHSTPRLDLSIPRNWIPPSPRIPFNTLFAIVGNIPTTSTRVDDPRYPQLVPPPRILHHIYPPERPSHIRPHPPKRGPHSPSLHVTSRHPRPRRRQNNGLYKASHYPLTHAARLVHLFPAE